MKQLDKYLAKWIGNGLLSAEQAEKIRAFEDAKSSKNWAAYSFLILGATVIVIGIISLVAANWYEIPNFAKLICGFLILGSFAYAVSRSSNSDKKYFFEVALVLFVLDCLATIGLISQIYNLGGEFYEAVFTWTVITLPVVLFSTRIFLPAIWAVSFLISSSLMAASSSLFLLAFGREAIGWLFLSVFTPLLYIFLSILLPIFKKPTHFTKIFRNLGILTALIAFTMSDVWISSRVGIPELTGSKNMAYSSVAFWFPSIILAIAVILVLNYKKLLSNIGTAVVTILIVLHLVSFYLVMHLHLYSSSSFIKLHNQFSGAFLSILSLFFASILAGILNKRNIFQTLVTFLGLRFLIVYFQAMGGLATTGVGLIISGVIILLMVYLWFKTRDSMKALTERLAGR